MLVVEFVIREPHRATAPRKATWQDCGRKERKAKGSLNIVSYVVQVLSESFNPGHHTAPRNVVDGGLCLFNVVLVSGGDPVATRLGCPSLVDPPALGPLDQVRGSTIIRSGYARRVVNDRVLVFVSLC